MSVVFTVMEAEPPLPSISKAPEKPSALVASEKVVEATFCAAATRRISSVWLPVAAALVVLTPSRLPASLGVPPSLRLLVAKACVAAKASPVLPSVTAPRRSRTESFRSCSRVRRSLSAAIFSVFSVMRVSIRSTGTRLAVMMPSTMVSKSRPELKPENETRPRSSTVRPEKSRASITPSRQPRVRSSRASRHRAA